MRLRYEGIDPVMLILSNEATEEIIKMMPHHVDRADTKKGIYKAGKHAFIFKPSTEKTMQRRKLMVSEVSFNRSSRFVPFIVQSTLDIIDNCMDESKVHEFVEISNVLTFDAFTSILFGSDQKELANKKYPFVMPDGSTKGMCLRDCVINSFKDHYSQLFHPLTAMARFLSDYNLCNPFKRDQKNLDTYLNALKKMFENAKDPNSISKRILANSDLSHFEKLHDINAFMAAGAETSSHGVASTIFLLKKFPEKLEKLREELKNHGVTKEYIRQGKFSMEDLAELDYLSYVVKESFRYESPGPEAFVYTPKRDITIRGVPIPKGMMIRNEIYSTHYNPNYWYKPFEFAPERFDVESSFYAEARKAGKAGPTHSRRTFGVGVRSCPGMSFATLEIKIAVAVFAVMIDWTFEGDLLTREGARFGIGSEVP